MEQPHRAVPMTGAICLGLACRIKGTVPNLSARSDDGPLVIAHLSDSVLVDADVDTTQGDISARSATVYRTARLLFSGNVHFGIANLLLPKVDLGR